SRIEALLTALSAWLPLSRLALSGLTLLALALLTLLALALLTLLSLLAALALLPLLTLLALLPLLAALGTERAIVQLPLSAQTVRETLDGVVHRVLLLVLLALLTLLALTGPALNHSHVLEHLHELGEHL